MLYTIYDNYTKSLGIMNRYNELANSFLPQNNLIKANYQLIKRFTTQYQKQPWNINTEEKNIYPKIVLSYDFCNLIEFNNNKTTNVLLIAPMSGHYATLLKPSISELIKEHNVFVTDWINPRDVSLEKGLFSLDSYIEYIIDFMQAMPKNYSIIAVCQPTVPASVACAYVSRSKIDCLPKDLILMGGPMKINSTNSTEVSELGVKKSYKWFSDNLIYKVPSGYEGCGRQVYPAFLQLSAFIQMNLPNHINKHIDLYKKIITDGETDSKTEDFYDEYLSVMDMDAAFYLQTIDLVFQRRLLTSKQGFPFLRKNYHLHEVDPKINILSIEGELDDIAKPGQTSEALKYFHPNSTKQSKIFSNVGHYGIFSGKKWKTEIRPLISDLINSK